MYRRGLASECKQSGERSFEPNSSLDTGINKKLSDGAHWIAGLQITAPLNANHCLEKRCNQFTVDAEFDFNRTAKKEMDNQLLAVVVECRLCAFPPHCVPDVSAS